MQGRLAEYRAVLAKVDAKFADIQGRFPESFACASGCHACCAPGLTVSGVERAAIAEHIGANETLRRTLATLEQERPHGDSRCRFLDGEGRCAIYSVRPVVCRSHGAPIRVPPAPVASGTAQDATVSTAGREGRLDACTLNFRTVPLSRLGAGDCIDVETLNTLLFVVGRRFDPTDAGARHPLTLRGVLGD